MPPAKGYTRPASFPTRACPTCGRVMVVCCLPKHERTHGDPRLRTLVPLDEQEQMVRLYNRPGGSLRKVAAATHWSNTVVLRVLRAHGVRMRSMGSAHRKISVDVELERAQLYGQGRSIAEVADITGVSYEAVRQTLVRLGVVRKRGPNQRWARRSSSTAARAA